MSLTSHVTNPWVDFVQNSQGFLADDLFPLGHLRRHLVHVIAGQPAVKPAQAVLDSDKIHVVGM